MQPATHKKKTNEMEKREPELSHQRAQKHHRYAVCFLYNYFVVVFFTFFTLVLLLFLFGFPPYIAFVVQSN